MEPADAGSQGPSALDPTTWATSSFADGPSGEKALERAQKGEKPEDEKVPGLVKVVLEGEMPMWYYAIAHPDARLSEAEKRELARGLAETFDLEYEPG